MPLTLQTVIGHMNLSDGVQAGGVRQGRGGQLIVAGLHGKYYESARDGNVFIQTTTPLGLAIPIYTSTAPRCMLLNPSGSGKNAVLIRISAARASGTTVEFAAGLMRVLSVGAGPATGAPVSALPGTTPFNGLVGKGKTSQMISDFAGTIATTAGAAGDFFYSLFRSYAAIGTSTAGDGEMAHNFEGQVAVPPGVAIWLAASVASVALYATTLVWEEVDI